MNFDKELGDIMVLEYCHEPKEGQGTPFEAFGTSLYFKKVSAQKVPNREIRGRLLSYCLAMYWGIGQSPVMANA